MIDEPPSPFQITGGFTEAQMYSINFNLVTIIVEQIENVYSPPPNQY